MNEFTPYSWTGIIDYIKSQKTIADKEKQDWEREKSNFLSLLQEKDTIISNLMTENKELVTRIAILEYSLRQESQKTTKIHHRVSSDQLGAFKQRQKEPNSLDEGLKLFATHRPTQSYNEFVESKFENMSIPAAKTHFDTKCITKQSWTPKISLKSHLDGVRGVYFVNKNVLASVSEDCTVKLWDCKGFLNDSDSFDPFLTLRGHTQAIFTIDGGHETIYTGDSSGIIRSWGVPDVEEVEPYGNYRNYAIHKWKAHNDCVWSIKYNPTDNLLISSSSDGSVKLWNLCSDKPSSKTFSYPGLFTPTCCNWVSSNLKYITVGYSSFITVFNIETSGFSKIPYSDEGFSSFHQVNSICSSSSTGLTITAHEDKRIRFFDLSSNSCIKDMVGHTDSVTDICLDSSGFYMVSTGHDGSVRSWDLRNYNCLHEVTLNRKKFEESIFCVAQHPESSILAIGGSDSLIKILEGKAN